MAGDNKTDVLVFDFDGTLIDSAPGILDAFAAALRETGVAPCVALDVNLIGPPLTETLMRLGGSDDPALVSALTEKFKHHYDSHGVATTAAYAGVDAMLDSFVAHGIELHIATNKRLSVTHAILEQLGWTERFASVYALDMVAPRLPGKAQLLSKQIGELNLDKTRTAYIGDKREDGHAAGDNGLKFYYASWGYGDVLRDQMNAGWHWLSTPADLCLQNVALLAD
ncbi:MAG: HAD family hydrolase [Sulfuriferula sp.]|nr:HAD family hydrolase [Sulfuriferula sp.]